MPNLVWKKTLSKTDAQQPTSGGLVPYLRLTSGNLNGDDYQSWFRDTFFASQNWSAGLFGKEHVEEATVFFDVSINGKNFGNRAFKVTHGADRMGSNNTPNTWLHWPNDIENLLQNNNLAGQPVTITRKTNGTFELNI